jgi:hypothetical protein
MYVHNENRNFTLITFHSGEKTNARTVINDKVTEKWSFFTFITALLVSFLCAHLLQFSQWIRIQHRILRYAV